MNFRGTIGRFRALTIGLAILAATVVPSSAAVVGQWSGSDPNRIWANNNQFSNIYNAAIGAGNTINAATSLTAALNGATHLIIAEPGGSPPVMTAAELVALSNWIGQGGILLLFVDFTPDSTAAANSILAGISYTANSVTSTTNIQYDNSQPIGGTLVAPANALASGLTSATPGAFAVNGGVNLAGSMLNVSRGYTVTGGNNIATGTLASFVRTDRIGLGTIFVFGDRMDVNTQASSSSTACSNTTTAAICQANLNFYLNILGGGGLSAPEPGSVILSGLGLLGLGLLGRRRRS